MLGSENNGTELRRANILRFIAVCTKDNLFFAQQAEKKMPIWVMLHAVQLLNLTPEQLDPTRDKSFSGGGQKMIR